MVEVEAQRQRCGCAPAADSSRQSSLSARTARGSERRRAWRSRSRACPCSSAGAPRASSRRSVSLSTRETKKLATECTARRVAAVGAEAREPLQVGRVRPRRSARSRRQRDVDRSAGRDRVFDRCHAGFVAGILTSRFGRSIRSCRRWPPRIGRPRRRRAWDRPRSRRSRPGPLGLLPYRTQQVAAGGDVGAGELEEDVLPARTAWQQLPQLRVVGVAVREIACSKMVGLEVTPTTASSRTSRASSPLSSRSRER